MKIGKNTVASIYYTLRATDSDVIIEQIPEDAPHEFLFGHELMLPDFEQELEGFEAGNTFSFSIACDNAYGPIDTYAIFDLPLDTFEENGKIDLDTVKVGNSFPMEDDMGNRHIGKIIRVMKESVTMDFNHPLAGKDIIFTGKVLQVRKASPEDIRRLVQS